MIYHRLLIRSFFKGKGMLWLIIAIFAISFASYGYGRLSGARYASGKYALTIEAITRKNYEALQEATRQARAKIDEQNRRIAELDEQHNARVRKIQSDTDKYRREAQEAKRRYRADCRLDDDGLRIWNGATRGAAPAQ